MLPADLDTVRLFLHVLAATVWVGGQITLGALVPVLRRAGVDVPRLAARQFGRIGWTAFAVLVLTGGWNVAAQDRTDDSDYTSTLTLKLAFVVLSGVAAFVHARARTPAALAVGGAGALVFSLGALFVGLMLSH